MAGLWIKRVLAAAAALAIAGAIVYAMLPAAVLVDLTVVGRGPLEVTVEDDGQTRIRERYVVSSPLAGRLLRIELRAGDPVEAGKTLLAVVEPGDPALLDARALAEAEARLRAAEAASKQAEPNLEQARAALDFARSEHRRLKRLHEQRQVALSELERAELEERTQLEAYRAAEYAVQIARFEADLARAALVRTRPESSTSAEPWRMEIHSPIDGRVLRVLQESALVVSAGTPLVELGDPSDLEVVVDVLSSDAVRIRPGDPVRLEHWGGENPLAARVRLVEPSGFTKISALGVEEQRVNVIIDFDGPLDQRAALGDGYRVEARVVIWQGDDVLQVPTSALFRYRGDWAVFVVERGRAVRRVVRLGQRSTWAAEVLEGLSAGEAVIIHPSDKVDPGVRVRPRDDG